MVYWGQANCFQFLLKIILLKLLKLNLLIYINPLLKDHPIVTHVLCLCNFKYGTCCSKNMNMFLGVKFDKHALILSKFKICLFQPSTNSYLSFFSLTNEDKRVNNPFLYLFHFKCCCYRHCIRLRKSNYYHTKHVINVQKRIQTRVRCLFRNTFSN